MEVVKGEFSGAVETGGHAATAGADGRVALGTGCLPGSADAGPGLALDRDVEPPSTGEAELAAVGMAAEDKIEPAFG